jgi:hypothetical protein
MTIHVKVKIDWDRYVDEDEEDGGFDTSAVSCCLNDSIIPCLTFSFRFDHRCSLFILLFNKAGGWHGNGGEI